MLDTDTQDCFYIYGQPESGKSAALNYFDDGALRQSYEIILIKGRCLFDLQDVDIIDILLMFSIELLKHLRKKDAFQDTIPGYTKNMWRRLSMCRRKRNEGEGILKLLSA